MGREAQVPCTVGGASETVKVLLESSELILRGSTIKRRYTLATLQRLRVVGDGLQFTAEHEAVTLQLGALEAHKWLLKINTPPPSLAAKLGITPDQPAAVFGPAADDAALVAALSGNTTDRLHSATLLVAVVLSADELTRALALHQDMPCRLMWVVNVKGKAAPLAEATIRETLRARGYTDNKTTAVSDRLTATRYGRRDDKR